MSSVKFFDKFPDQVYVWAKGRGELTTLAGKYTYMFHNHITIIPHEDWLRLYSSVDSSFEQPVPAWVRVKSGLYKDDLAILERSYSSGHFDILLVPRAIGKPNKRPNPRLIPLSYAQQHWGIKAVSLHSTEPHWFTVKKMSFKGPLVPLYRKRETVTMSLPNDLSELSPFLEALSLPGGAYMSDFVLKTSKDIKIRDALTVFRLNDRVVITKGSFVNSEGRIQDIQQGTHATVLLDLPAVDVEEAVVTLKDLRRVFKEGDDICVRSGREKGRKGPVLKVDGSVLTFVDLDTRVAVKGASASEPAVPVEVCAANPCIIPIRH